MKSVRSAQPYRPNHPILCTDCHVYYDTIRDAILTCAQKLTQSQLNLPHGIEQLKSGKKEKVKKDMLRSIGIRGIREVSPVVASKERRRRSLAELRPVVSHGDWRKARFDPRDAMLARVLVMALSPSACLSVCLSVCISVTCRCSIKWNEPINLVCGTGASFDQSCTVFKEIQVSTKYGYFPLELFPKLRKLRHGISIVETCYQLSSMKLSTLRARYELDRRRSSVS